MTGRTKDREARLFEDRRDCPNRGTERRRRPPVRAEDEEQEAGRSDLSEYERNRVHEERAGLSGPEGLSTRRDRAALLSRSENDLWIVARESRSPAPEHCEGDGTQGHADHVEVLRASRGSRSA